MKAFFLLAVVVATAVFADDKVKEEKAEAPVKKLLVEVKEEDRAALVRAAQEAVELGARVGAADVTQRTASPYHWAYPRPPPSAQLSLSGAEDALYRYEYSYPYYTYSPYDAYYWYGAYYPYNYYYSYPYTWYYDWQ